MERYHVYRSDDDGNPARIIDTHKDGATVCQGVYVELRDLCATLNKYETGAADAQATVEALQAQVKELEESRDAWKASQECSEKAYMALVNQIPAERFDYDPVNVALLDGAKEQEIIGRKQIADLQDLLKRTDENREQWRKLCQEAQSQITQRTAELEAAKTRAHESESKATEFSVKLQQAREERDNLRLRIQAVDKEHEQLAVDRQKMTGTVESLLTERDNLRAELERVRGERDEQIRERERYFQLWMQATEERNEMRKERDEAQWPNVLAPAMYDNPDPGWKDTQVPDLTRIWGLAREVGYAVGLHGSLKRDMDLIAVPWAEEAVGNAELIDHLCKGLPAVRIGGPEHKPHKRVAVTLQMDGYFKPIDLSIVYRTTTLQAALRDEQETVEGYKKLQALVRAEEVADGKTE